MKNNQHIEIPNYLQPKRLNPIAAYFSGGLTILIASALFILIKDAPLLIERLAPEHLISLCFALGFACICTYATWKHSLN